MDIDKLPRGNAAIEFHDSTVSIFEPEGASLTICLSPAYVHRADGARRTGWNQEAIMELHEWELSGIVPQLPCILFSGSVSAGAQIYGGLIPAPLIHVGSVDLALTFEDGTEIQIKAKKLRIELVGIPVYVEEGP